MIVNGKGNSHTTFFSVLWGKHTYKHIGSCLIQDVKKKKKSQI